MKPTKRNLMTGMVAIGVAIPIIPALAQSSDTLPPPDVRLAAQDGNTVTLVWTDDCQPGGTCQNYEAFDGPTMWTTGYGIDHVTLSRLHAGETALHRKPTSR